MSNWPYGSQQSPVDIRSMSTYPVVFPVDYLVVQYPNEELAGYFNHTNHNFYFDAPPTIRYAGVEAPLERIHIHSRSEHLLDGVDFDFEIHFVHPLPNPVDPTSTTGDSTHVVFGVFFKESSSATTPRTIRLANDSIRSMINREEKRLSLSQTRIEFHVNPLDFLPANRSQFFRYEGSLTTPDPEGYFKERVTWIVFPHVVEVRPVDIAELKLHAHEHARIAQQLNRRFVLKNFV